MSTYQNEEGAAKYILKSAEVFTSNPIRLKLQDLTQLDEAEGMTSDTSEQSVVFGLTETLVLKGTWSSPIPKDTEDDEEDTKEDTPTESQCVRISLRTHPLTFDTQGLSELYISMKKPNDNFGPVRREIRKHPHTGDLAESLVNPQQSGFEKTTSFTLVNCLLHMNPRLTREDVRDWNCRVASRQSATTQINHYVEDDAETSSGLGGSAWGKIIGETSLGVAIRVCEPTGGPQSDENVSGSDSEVFDPSDEEFDYVVM